MAGTRVQLGVEDWVRQDWMPKHFSVNFDGGHLKIRSVGAFDFDAVSADKWIVAMILTSGATSWTCTVCGAFPRARLTRCTTAIGSVDSTHWYN